MYLSNIKLWNFRKFGSSEEFSLDKPNLNLNFTQGLNVLIGENDSGKSAIIDAIKLVLRTHSYEWLQILEEDFYQSSDRFRIELRFDDLADNEAKNFTEWLGWVGEGEGAKTYLRLILDVKRNMETGRIASCDVRAGVDEEGYLLNAEAKDFLKVTYLKPLRDAGSELTPKKNSRLSKILQGHDAFKDSKGHHLVEEFSKVNKLISEYFTGITGDGIVFADQKGKELKEEIDSYIKNFYDSNREGLFGVTKEDDIKSILEKLELSIKDLLSPGLGTLNRLFMSAELLHLKKKNWDGIKLGLIEELEAHLHPQAQMQIIESFQKEKEIQLIITTHSPNIGSKLKLESLIICSNRNAYPMGNEYTKLPPDDYKFLEKFLDVTKANLFFARGVIMVEGWAEEILIPSIARKLGINLTQKGVSIINIGNTAFLRYSNIFKRTGAERFNIPVSIVTDLDIKPEEEPARKDEVMQQKTTKFNDQTVKVFISPRWTLEYCLFLSTSLSNKFKHVVQEIHAGTDWTNFEDKLIEKLEKKTLNKVEIAYRLAAEIDEDFKSETPQINLNAEGDVLNYLIEAIKYAANN